MLLHTEVCQDLGQSPPFQKNSAKTDLFLDVKINSFDGQSFMIELKKAPLVLGLMLDSFDTQSMRLDSPPVTEL